MLYGLPKVHKPEVLLRPIVSFLRSPTYKLHLATILSPLVGNSSSYVRNSKAFADFIKPQVLTSDELLVSFDVVSLFTNIPVHLATEVAQRRLRGDADLKDRTSLSVEVVMKLLEFCLSATFLAFRGDIYQQTFGTAMGSLVSVTIANLVMEDVEERALATTDITLKFWKRYVDNTCAALPASSVLQFLDHLNGAEPSIQFTVELESNGKLPFLDVLLQRDPDGSISTTVYRKATHTDRYLDFRSHHPLAHKLVVVKTLHGMAEAICSDVTAKDQEIRQALINNGYPRGVLEHHATPAPTRSADGHSRGPVITLSYVRGLSEAVRRVLTPLGLRVSFRPNTTIKQLLVRPKDRTLTEEMAGVVYQVPASYVGQTGRCLGKRMKEHRKAVKSGDCANSALAEHAWSHHHPVDWDKVRVLEQQPHLYHRLTLGSIHIRSHPHTLTRSKGQGQHQL